MEKTAFKLIQQYMAGWIQNDLKLITSCLLKNCIIIESHGPTYQGINEVERWFKLWLEAKSKVTTWNILSFYYCERKSTAFIEWHFSCISNNNKYAIPGSSIIKYSKQKIASIHEYRMTHPTYLWAGDKLISE